MKKFTTLKLATETLIVLPLGSHNFFEICHAFAITSRHLICKNDFKESYNSSEQFDALVGGKDIAVSNFLVYETEDPSCVTCSIEKTLNTTNLFESQEFQAVNEWAGSNDFKVVFDSKTDEFNIVQLTKGFLGKKNSALVFDITGGKPFVMAFKNGVEADKVYLIRATDTSEHTLFLFNEKKEFLGKRNFVQGSGDIVRGGANNFMYAENFFVINLCGQFHLRNMKGVSKKYTNSPDATEITGILRKEEYRKVRVYALVYKTEQTENVSLKQLKDISLPQTVEEKQLMIGKFLDCMTQVLAKRVNTTTLIFDSRRGKENGELKNAIKGKPNVIIVIKMKGGKIFGGYFSHIPEEGKEGCITLRHDDKHLLFGGEQMKVYKPKPKYMTDLLSIDSDYVLLRINTCFEVRSTGGVKVDRRELFKERYFDEPNPIDVIGIGKSQFAEYEFVLAYTFE
ncbi:hypothetical protein EIN_369560 [Entamoeba invadens IP1]|uniref:Uncharacterized protein n=1 Tax=Entamoeba invadens IP1 TaxID=370355 RepID=A0A0A1UFB7_ENTIV|nr:hypothetical protein EIN_369560 [Entamoeba invadens IP1]ELP92634.1 hypothetical protein EIN_369560 [Entamoeba invadens IP1]|eukprot:XP_004259405.1 hypothetical protein EIN_369560 [Entamoeba invadens IP1]